MPYTLNNFDGRTFKVLEDGVLDRQASSSLYLIGKAVTNYGTYQNDNFLWLMENFAGTVEPVNKVQGQIWFDKTSGVMKPKVYNGTEWRGLTFITAASADSATSVSGDFWFDTSNSQLHIKNTSSQYTLIGPEAVAGFGITKMSSEEVLDTNSIGHACIVMYLDGVIIGAVSNDEFFVKTTEEVYLAGIEKIGRGFTFIDAAEVTTSKVYAQQTVDETITGKWTFNNVDGINIQNSKIAYTGTSLIIQNTASNIVLDTGNILPNGSTTILGSSSNKFAKVYASELTGGTSISPVTLTGQFSLAASSKLSPGADSTINLGAANARWATVFTSGLNAGSTTAEAGFTGNWSLTPDSTLNVSGGNFVTDSLTTGLETSPGSIVGNWTVTGNSNLTFEYGNLTFGTGNLDVTNGSLLSTTLSTGDPNTEGDITGDWRLTSGSRLRATYADIAEKYSSDQNYNPGTVVELGGDAEVTICTSYNSEKVAGIVTTNPAYLLNEALENSVAIALVGRVPCKVVGNIVKGNFLVSSNIPGCAMAQVNPRPGTIIAKALQSYNSNDPGIIEVMVYRG